MREWRHGVSATVTAGLLRKVAADIADDRPHAVEVAIGEVASLPAEDAGHAVHGSIDSRMRSRRPRYAFLSALGLCATRSPGFLLRMRYSGLSFETLYLVPFDLLGEVSLFSTTPRVSPCDVLH
jgi:hypothetical protein